MERVIDFFRIDMWTNLILGLIFVTSAFFIDDRTLLAITIIFGIWSFKKAAVQYYYQKSDNKS